ncbi:hypothetical protein [Pseudarthrobacter phenanthrenivorans]|uniref:hypothetical protein n=1 Tax=Pseudarthrobacter phenanthrenivorans TaxID=361575 RepID=UPI0012E02187|nr:hypothetical protein [Pseudarthrobacter phenanthrenivorans]
MSPWALRPAPGAGSGQPHQEVDPQLSRVVLEGGGHVVAADAERVCGHRFHGVPQGGGCHPGVALPGRP